MEPILNGESAAKANAAATPTRPGHWSGPRSSSIAAKTNRFPSRAGRPRQGGTNAVRETGESAAQPARVIVRTKASRNPGSRLSLN